MQVRFEILGPLRAWRGDQELDLGPAKQCAVLAVLLLNANRPVPTSKIVDAVWTDDPPENGPNVVQKYVAGLRRVLEPDRSPRAPGRLLARSDAGYTLRTTPDTVDADVFRSWVRQAQATRAAGALADASQMLRGALAMWRSEAMAGLYGPVFEAARDRLAESRAAALESWAEIELELGHHAELVPELVKLVAELPLREHLRYLLILALYQMGRQAEALAAYRDARSFLVEEFGVEPGERLQQLHLRILQADPTLAGPSHQASPPQPQPAGPPGRRWHVHLLRPLAVLIPLISLGSASWAVIAFFAAARHSWPLAGAAAGYLGMFVGFLMLPDAGEAGDLLAALVTLLLAGATIGAATHGAVLAYVPRRGERLKSG